MKEVECVNCGISNSVEGLDEDFKCGECGEINKGIDINDLYDLNQNEQKISDQLRIANDQLSDRLRERDNEIWRLCRLLDENNINYEVES